jgi:hypothetical protein
MRAPGWSACVEETQRRAPPRSSWPCSAVAKGSQLGSMRNAGAYPGSGSRGEQRAKHARRPGMRPHAETDRRRRLVADHRATVGDWCAGLDKHLPTPRPTWWPTMSSTWQPEGQRLARRGCSAGEENGRRSARVLTTMLGPDPSPAEHAITDEQGRWSREGGAEARR